MKLELLLASFTLFSATQVDAQVNGTLSATQVCTGIPDNCKAIIESKFFGKRVQTSMRQGHAITYLKKCAKKHFTGLKCKHMLGVCDVHEKFPCHRKLNEVFPDDAFPSDKLGRSIAVRQCQVSSSFHPKCGEILTSCANAIKIYNEKKAAGSDLVALKNICTKYEYDEEEEEDEDGEWVLAVKAAADAAKLAFINKRAPYEAQLRRNQLLKEQADASRILVYDQNSI